MGIYDIMQLVNDPEFTDKIRGLVEAASPILKQVQRTQTTIELIAEKLDISQKEIDDRLILKQGVQNGEMPELRNDSQAGA